MKNDNDHIIDLNIFELYVFENFQLHKTFTHSILNYIGHSFEVTFILKQCMRRKYLLFTRTRASVALFEKSRKQGRQFVLVLST